MPIHAPWEHFPVQKCKCFNSCLTFTILVACPIPERKLPEHDQSSEIHDMGPTSAFRTEFAPFEGSCCIQVRTGHSSVGMQYSGAARDRQSTRHTCLTLLLTEQSCWALRGNAPPCRSCLLEGCAVWFWVSIEATGADLRIPENPQLFLWDLLEASEKWVWGQDSLMRDSEPLCPSTMKLLLNSGEFYQLIQWEWSQHWMLLYLWLCLRRDRSSFTITSLYYNKAPNKGT